MQVLDTGSMLTYSLTIIPVAISVCLGAKLRSKLSEDRFRKLIMVLIVFWAMD